MENTLQLIKNFFFVISDFNKMNCYTAYHQKSSENKSYFMVSTALKHECNSWMEIT